MMKKNDLLVYVTNEQGQGQEGGAPSSMKNNMLVVTPEHHDQLFGSTLAWLRASALEVELENSAIQAESKDVVNLKASPALKSRKCSIS